MDGNLSVLGNTTTLAFRIGGDVKIAGNLELNNLAVSGNLSSNSASFDVLSISNRASCDTLTVQTQLTSASLSAGTVSAGTLTRNTLSSNAVAASVVVARYAQMGTLVVDTQHVPVGRMPGQSASQGVDAP